MNQSHRHRTRSGSYIGTPAAISGTGIRHADELSVNMFVVPVGIDLIEKYLRKAENGDRLV